MGKPIDAGKYNIAFFSLRNRTILALVTQKPGRLVTSLETISESGRSRRAKEEEKKLQTERLKAVGFSDEEIDEFLQ